MLHDLFAGLALTDYVIILAGLGYVVWKILEATGRTKSSALLRRENEDLVRRNAELESTTDRQTTQINELKQKVAVLEHEMEALRQRDQAAVLEALQKHEVGAESRATRTHALQEQTTDILKQIASALETTN